jgi:hypothetical protein
VKIHQNAESVIRLLRDRGEPMTVSEIMLIGTMDARSVSDAVQYGTRNGAIERVMVPGPRPTRRFRYRLTGEALLPLKHDKGASFDALLTAWGIPCEPPPRRHRAWRGA